MIVQLKPHREAFTAFVFNRLKRLDTIVLCEGKTEAQVYKAVVRKLCVEHPGTLGVTDCEGITEVPKITAAIALLTALARRLRTIAVIVDAEHTTHEERLRSLLDSLESTREIRVARNQAKAHHAQVYETTITSPRQLRLLVAVSGDPQLPYQIHAIEDHLVNLAILEGLLTPKQAYGTHTAKQTLALAGIQPTELIEKAKPENVEKALEHLALLAKLLQHTQQ